MKINLGVIQKIAMNLGWNSIFLRFVVLILAVYFNLWIILPYLTLAVFFLYKSLTNCSNCEYKFKNSKIYCPKCGEKRPILSYEITKLVIWAILLIPMGVALALK